MKKKIISLILSAAMVATATVVPVSAADVKDFADVAADSWYYDSVDFVAERDYMNGTSATTFSPNDNMTRAMFVTVMARVAGAQTDNNAVTEFTDVPSGQWYTGAVQWGVEKGLVQGHGDGTFGTNDPITRQDTAVLAQRFLKWYSEATGLTPETGAKVDSFTDASSISDYAKDAVEYCRQIGLLTGYEDGSFQPLKSITRAEAATILKRMTFLAEGVLTVTYTDENGKTVMMEVKEGDTFTVDPNGGKITYDGKTYDAEFTITVGTASLTLPAPTRSGYTFKGWKVTEVADGTPVFTAQWASSGGGGGGGSTVVAEETYTYQVFVNAKKTQDLELQTFTSKSHEVNFDAKGDAINPSEVSLINLAKELVINDGGDPNAQIIQIINALPSTGFFEKDEDTKETKAKDVTVKTLKASDIIETDDISETDEALVKNVLNILDTGVTTQVAFTEKWADSGNGNNVDAALEVVKKIEEELKKVNVGNLSTYIDDDTEDLIETIGISKEKIVTAIGVYAGVLNGIHTGNTAANPVTGVEIKLNLVDVLNAQYGENGEGAKDYIEKALQAAGASQYTIDKIFAETSMNNLIELCDPEKFFEGYTLQSTKNCANALVNIIECANQVRIDCCVGDNALLSEQQIENFIVKSIEKAEGYVNDSQKENLKKIKDKSDELAGLCKEEDPTLLDLLEILKGSETTGDSITVNFNLSQEKIGEIIDKIFEKIGVDENQIDTDLINKAKTKLAGKYTFGVTIDVQKQN